MKHPPDSASVNGKGFFGYVIGTFFLTISNPLTILTFIAIFTRFGIADEITNYFTASLLVSGVFLGSIFWWLLLTGFLRLSNIKMDQKKIIFINKCSGIIIASFGVLSLTSLLIIGH